MLLARVRTLTMLAVIGLLPLLHVTPWSLLSIRWHLLAVLHPSLHAHRVSLRARGPVALAWVSRSLLGP